MLGAAISFCLINSTGKIKNGGEEANPTSLASVDGAGAFSPSVTPASVDVGREAVTSNTSIPYSAKNGNENGNDILTSTMNSIEKMISPRLSKSLLPAGVGYGKMGKNRRCL